MTLVNSATGYAEGLVKRIDALNDRADKVGDAFDAFRKEQLKRNEQQDIRNRQQDTLLLAHSRWDHQVVSVANANGIPLEPPPPLFLHEGSQS